jgi:hypothetical protein
MRPTGFQPYGKEATPFSRMSAWKFAPPAAASQVLFAKLAATFHAHRGI